MVSYLTFTLIIVKQSVDTSRIWSKAPFYSMHCRDIRTIVLKNIQVNTNELSI